ncbi:MAG: AraC family transcriptional regulator [Cytophagales bacterium]|nr:AraC family transcriptional regulator [Armatimonadota bacterium]
MDVFAEVLQGIHVRSIVLHHGRIHGPWGICFPQEMGSYDAMFHVVTEGGGLLEVEGVPGPVRVAGGDVVVLPHGTSHTMRDSPSTPVGTLEAFRAMVSATASGDEVKECAAGQSDHGDQETRFLCGKFFFENAETNPLFRALPPLLLVRGEAGQTLPWLAPTLAFLRCESESGRPGAETVIARLCDILFIQAVRAYVAGEPPCASSGGLHGYLRALGDQDLGAVFQAVHRRPEEAWTVASMASRAALSRSAFAARFTQLVGEPPLQYVTRWRIHVAARLLRRGGVPLAEIAGQVGYASEASFCSAFKRLLGVSPGAYRHPRPAEVPRQAEASRL